jgi:hypothetical protein
MGVKRVIIVEINGSHTFGPYKISETSINLKAKYGEAEGLTGAGSLSNGWRSLRFLDDLCRCEVAAHGPDIGCVVTTFVSEVVLD